MSFHNILIFFLCLNFQVFGATILITGANRGIGLEFARQYSERGDKVIATARDPNKAEALKELGVRIEQLDVTDTESVAQLVKQLDGLPIDRLINNAGIFRGRSDRIEDLEMEDFNQSFAVNATGPIRVAQALLPNLKKGELKQIINISSQLGSIQNNQGGMYAYRASKAALNQITRTMSLELGREGFICIAIHPGWVKTDMGGVSATFTPKESVQAMTQTIDQLTRRSNGAYIDLNGGALPW